MELNTILYIWMGIAIILTLLFFVQIVVIIFIGKKTHAILEFKASFSRNPIALFFSDNKYVTWTNVKPDAGMIDDKEFGNFIIDSTYIDNKTKNIFIPCNTSFAMSVNVKSAKLVDDLRFMLKNQNSFSKLKFSILEDQIDENDGVNTLRTTVDFSSLKHIVPPILPHSLKSKIVSTVQLRLKDSGMSNAPNIALYIISALGALILGGIVLYFML